MIINGVYEFRDKHGNEIEPTKAQLLIFISDVLQRRDDEIKVLNKALELATEELSDAKDMLFAVDEADKANWIDDGMDYYLAKARYEIENAGRD